jgi:hypothetical protein
MRRLAVAVLLATLVAFPGCRSSGTFRSPFPKEEVAAGRHEVRTIEDVRTRLDATTAPHPELWVRAGITIRQGGDKNFISTVTLFRSPDQLRMRGSRLDINLFDLLLDGNAVSFLLNREGKRFDGSLEELGRLSQATGGLTPKDLVSAVLVRRSLQEVLASGNASVDMPREGHLLIAGLVGKDQTGLWLVRQEDGMVREFLLRDRDQQDLVRIQYEAYELTGPMREPLPSKLRMKIPRTGAELLVDISEYRLEPKLRDAQFRPPKARTVLPLADLQFEATP